MFKNYVIALLLVSTLVFGWLAVRNTTPLECSETLVVNHKSICIIEKLSTAELDNVIQSLKVKYINE